MQYFLDSANLDEIHEARRSNLLQGLTTNPTLLLQANNKEVSDIELYREICSLVPGPVSLEVAAHEATSADAMVREGTRLFEIAENVVVKVPATVEGLRATEQLALIGKVNVTLVFRLTQALEAARCGAAYVSPFLGRLQDSGINDFGMQLISDIHESFYHYGVDDMTKILAASIRSTAHVHEVYRAGADCVTMPPKVFRDMVNWRHHRRSALRPTKPEELKSIFTDQGLAQFDRDHQARSDG